MSYKKTFESVSEILKALDYAEDKHPGFPEDIVHKTAILAEEIGEAFQAVNDYMWDSGDINLYRKEIAQIGAVAIRILNDLKE